MSRASDAQHWAYCDSQDCDCNDEQCVTCEGWFSAKELRGYRCWECRGDEMCTDCEWPYPPSEMRGGTLCRDCLDNRAFDLAKLLDALWGEPCIDCGQRIRGGLQCTGCIRKAQALVANQPRQCLRCGAHSGDKPFCGQVCEDAERFSEVSA